jgi:hypothetical protein
VAVVRRGGCEFVDKAARVQQAGAIAMVIVNYDDEDVKAGSAEGGAADSIAIPVVTVRRSVGAPLLANAAQVADTFEDQQHTAQPQRRRERFRGVEVDIAFGAARHRETATSSPRGAQEQAQELFTEEQPSISSQYWEAVEAAWRREGGWRGDPELRGRQVVVSSNRLRRAGIAGRTVGVVNGDASAMEWEDNWPALSAQAEMLFTRRQIYAFAGYSHHYGGFWRFEGDTSNRAVGYPYTEAGLQAVAPLWLASILFCEVPPTDPAGVAAGSCDSEDSLDGSSSGESELGDEDSIDRDRVRPFDNDRPMADVGPISFDSSPYLNLNCSNAIAASRASALLQRLRSGAYGVAASLKLHYLVLDVLLVRAWFTVAGLQSIIGGMLSNSTGRTRSLRCAWTGAACTSTQLSRKLVMI